MYDTFSPSRQLAAAPPKTTPSPEREGSVLVVGTNRKRRESMQTALISQGILALGTSSEHKALELLHDGMHFDAVLIQTESERSDGFALHHQFTEHFPTVPVLTVCANCTASLRQQDAADLRFTNAFIALFSPRIASGNEDSP